MERKYINTFNLADQERIFCYFIWGFALNTLSVGTVSWLYTLHVFENASRSNVKLQTRVSTIWVLLKVLLLK